MSLNKVLLIGNVGKDPEVRYLDTTQPPQKVATFSLATTERYKDKNGQIQETTEWHNLVAWRNIADTVEKYVTKGKQLYIEGKLRTRNYNDRTGTKKYVTEIIVDELQLLGQKSDSPQQRDIQGTAQYLQGAKQVAQQSQQMQQPSRPATVQPVQTVIPQAPMETEEVTDDLPF